MGMVLRCATCDKVFNSLIIDKVLAWNECYGKLTQHAVKRHPEALAELQVGLQKAMVSLSCYVTASSLAVIPEDEVYLNLLMDEFQRDIMDAAGFDMADDEGEDEKEDDDLQLIDPEEEEKEGDKEVEPLELEVTDKSKLTA